MENVIVENKIVIDWDTRLPGTIRVGWRIFYGEKYKDTWWGNSKNEESLSLLLLDVERKYGKKEVVDLRKLKEIAKEIEKKMQCNCDLDNWQPERDTGHTRVCRIDKTARAQHRLQADGLPRTV